MKIDKKLFEEFLNRATLNGNISKGIIEFTEFGVKFNARSEDNIALIDIKMEKKEIEGYENIGILPIEELNILRKAVKERFSGVIELIKTEGSIIMKDSKNKCEFMLTSDQFINNKMEVPKLEIAESFIINNSIFDEAFKNTKALGINENDSKYKMILEPGKLSITVGDNHLFTVSEKIESEIKAKQNVKLGGYINSLTNVTAGNINIKMESDKPVMITDDYEGKIKSTILIAPIIDDNGN